jgi:hypothetical protein
MVDACLATAKAVGREKIGFVRMQPFPYGLQGGKGFLREDEVDLEKVSRHAA